MNIFIDTKDNNKIILLYYDDNDYIGFIVCDYKEFETESKQKKIFSRIKLIYVLEEYRHGGIASEMVEHFERCTIKNKCDNIIAFVLNKNFSVINFYQKLGYKMNFLNKYCGKNLLNEKII